MQRIKIKLEEAVETAEDGTVLKIRADEVAEAFVQSMTASEFKHIQEYLNRDEGKPPETVKLENTQRLILADADEREDAKPTEPDTALVSKLSERKGLSGNGSG